jgi:ubiquinone/menaquinone biosynthesis C-methylase UbiE
MGFWLAPLYDRVMHASEEACLKDWRRALLRPARGRVLEIGAGTGANLPHYGPEVSELVLAEPDPRMRRQLAQALESASRRATLSDARADALPFEDARFDAVVSTLVLCSVGSLERSLSEIARVLTPGGRLYFLEHVAADERPERLRWQRLAEPVWKRIAGNCHLTRRTEDAIASAGFEIETITRESIRKAMALARPSIRGVARKPG